MDADLRLQSISHPLVRELAAHGDVRTYPKNSVLLNEGDAGDSIYVVLSGRLKVYVSDTDGHEMVIGDAGPGEHVGEMAFDGGVRAASVITTEPTVCAIVSRRQLCDAIARNPEVAIYLLATVIDRARQAIGNVKGLALLDGYGRLARLLDTLAVERGSERVVEEQWTQHDYGARIGASRDVIARLFKDLSAGGYLTINADRSIVLHRKLPPRW